MAARARRPKVLSSPRGQFAEWSRGVPSARTGVDGDDRTSEMADKGAVRRAGADVADPTLDSETLAGLEARARSLVTQLEGATGSKALRILDNLAAECSQAQRRAASSLYELRLSVEGLLLRTGVTPRDLEELRKAVEQLIPSERSVPPPLRLLARFLRVKGRHASLETARKYDEFARTAEPMRKRLEGAKLSLRRDSIELRRLGDRAHQEQGRLQREFAFTQIVARELLAFALKASDGERRGRFEEAIRDLARTEQDLLAMQELLSQFRATIDIYRQSNASLIESIDLMLVLVANALAAGIAIQSASAQQRRARRASERTRVLVDDFSAARADVPDTEPYAPRDVQEEPAQAVANLRISCAELLQGIDRISNVLARQSVPPVRAETAES